MKAEDKLRLLEELEQLDQYIGIGTVTFEQLPDNPAQYICSHTPLFAKPVTRAEAMQLLSQYGIDAVFFNEHGDPTPTPQGMYEIDFTD